MGRFPGELPWLLDGVCDPRLTHAVLLRAQLPRAALERELESAEAQIASLHLYVAHLLEQLADKCIEEAQVPRVQMVASEHHAEREALRHASAVRARAALAPWALPPTIATLGDGGGRARVAPEQVLLRNAPRD